MGWKMVTKNDIWKKLIELSEKIELMNEELICVQKTQLKLIGIFDKDKLEAAINMLNAQFNKILDETKFNLARVNAMGNELKGVVSMARAALDEGRKFTELTELSNILNHISGDVHRLGNASDRLDKIADKLLVSCEVPCKKESRS